MSQHITPTLLAKPATGKGGKVKKYSTSEMQNIFFPIYIALRFSEFRRA